MSISSEEKRGDQLVLQAQATLGKWSFFSSSNKYDDASELYAKAAHNYKIAKKWQKAADTFIKVAELVIKTGYQVCAFIFY